jgi:hypothetical protein
MTPPTEYIQADGFEEALIGFAEVWQAGRATVAVYDGRECIEILARDMPYEDAEEFFELNVLGSYVGGQTPIFVFPADVTKPDSPSDGDAG